ncbi:MAG: HD domain-containing protein [Candidatus Gracilibacteria bacterium]
MIVEAKIDYNKTFEEIVERLLEALAYLDAQDIQVVKKAVEIAKEAHSTQERMSGEPYIFHPIRVALIMSEYKLPAVCIIAGLLHDTIEDGGLTEDYLAEQFSNECAELVDGVTKFAKDKFREAETKDRQIESIRKMFEVMQHNIKIPIIKLYDRLDNARSFDIFREDKRIRLAQETLHIHVKLAEALLVIPIAEELKKICFGILYPKETQIYLTNVELRKKALQDTCDYLHKEFPNFKFKVDSDLFAGALINNSESVSCARVKDLFISCITSTEKEAYQMLDLLHKNFESLSIVEDSLSSQMNQKKEIITKISGNVFKPCFIHITTEDLYTHNRLGIVHGIAKNQNSLVDHETKQWIPNLDHLCELNQENSEIFWNELHASILSNNITVFIGSNESHYVVTGSNVLETLLLTHTQDIFSISHICINDKTGAFNTPVSSKDHITFERGETSLLHPEDVMGIKTSLGRKLFYQQISDRKETDKIIWGSVMLRSIFIYESLSSEERAFQNWIEGLMLHFSVLDVAELYEKIFKNTKYYDILVKTAYDYRPEINADDYILLCRVDNKEKALRTAESIDKYYKQHSASVEKVRYHTIENGIVIEFTVNKHQTYTYGALIKLLFRFDLVEFSLAPSSSVSLLE